MTSEKRISDEAVRAKTGRGWAGWLSLLDAWGKPIPFEEW